MHRINENCWLAPASCGPQLNPEAITHGVIDYLK